MKILNERTNSIVQKTYIEGPRKISVNGTRRIHMAKPNVVMRAQGHLTSLSYASVTIKANCLTSVA